MAVNITTVLDAQDVHIVDIEATADGDTTATIPHTLGDIPVEVVITGLNTDAQLSLWTTTTINATNVVLTKTTAVGSGGAGNQVRAIIKRLLSTWPSLPIKLAQTGVA